MSYALWGVFLLFCGRFGRDLIIPEKKPIINPENAGLSEFKRIEAGCSEALKADFISHGGKKGH